MRSVSPLTKTRSSTESQACGAVPEKVGFALTGISGLNIARLPRRSLAKAG